jgi:hypothetical protein
MAQTKAEKYFKTFKEKYQGKFIYFNVQTISIACYCGIDTRLTNIKQIYKIYSIGYPTSLLACVVCNKSVSVRMEFLTNSAHKLYTKCAIV